MMTPEEVKIVQMVYTRFLEAEGKGWTSLDDALEVMEWLSDKDIITESDIKCETHSMGSVRCKNEHAASKTCFAPFILEAVISILELHDETKELHAKNRYILAHYLAMSELGLIYSES